MNVAPVARDHGHLLVVEEDDVAGVREDGRHVGGDEVLAVAEADDDRRAVADGDELVRVVGREQHEREQPAHAGSSPPHRALEAVVLPLLLDQVRDDLGVGLGLRTCALRRLQLALRARGSSR